MHGTEHCRQERRTFRLSAPRPPPFDDCRIKASKPAAVHSPARDRMLVTAFRSPATVAPCGASIPGLTLLACYFASSPAVSTTRSAFLLRYRCRFAPASAASLLQTRCGFHDQFEELRSPPPLPFGTFTSLRIKAFSEFPNSSARLPTPPDFPSLPAADFYC